MKRKNFRNMHIFRSAADLLDASVLNELEEQVDQFELRQKVSAQDWINYKDRWKAFGEEAALQWLVAKYGER